MIPKIKEKILKRIKARHIVGHELVDALKVCSSINQSGYKVTLGYWSGPSDSPELVQKVLFNSINAIEKNNLNARLAIKLQSLGNNHTLLNSLVEVAKEKNIQLHFDSLSLNTVDRTLEIAQNIYSTYSNVGCTLPARFKRSIKDARELRNTGINIRVVKGHWTDPVNSVACRKNFIEIVETLAGCENYISVATHDKSLAMKTLKVLMSAGTACELEQMISLPLLTANDSFNINVPVRIYVPFGHPYLPYSIRFAFGRPEIIYWFIKDLLSPQKNFKNFRFDKKTYNEFRPIINNPIV